MIAGNPLRDDPRLAAIAGISLAYGVVPKTWMATRTRVAVQATVHTPRGLRDLLRLARDNDWPLLMLGEGSNTIFASDEFDGIVVALDKRMFGNAEYIGDNMLRVGAARNLMSLVPFAHRAGLMGLEFCTKIPGQLGGALAGNAGAGELGICDCIDSVIAVTRSGRLIQVGQGEFEYGYRHSELAEAVILEADLRLEPLNEVRAKRAVQDFAARKVNQPYKLPSSGCIFKNPVDPATGESIGAGMLIDQAGLKGYAVNGAAVSEMHANFIVNTGNARGEDFLALISLIQDVVHHKTGIELEIEARIAGGPLTSCVLH